MCNKVQSTVLLRYLLACLKNPSQQSHLPRPRPMRSARHRHCSTCEQKNYKIAQREEALAGI